MSLNSTSIILTHGAWTDGSSWSKIILPLERHGFRVVAAPIPLTSLSDDIAALNRVIERTNGPMILAAHAYAGAVISAANNARVKSLVYVAALTPDQGETVGDVFYRGKRHPRAPQLVPDADGLIWMPEQGFGDAFAPNAPPDMIAILAATQRPIALRCIQNETLVVFSGGRRPHDQSRDPTFYGATDGREDSFPLRRSHAARYRAGAGRRCHSRSCGRYDKLITATTMQITQR
jgi:pimeloyl-ACP methyl ester carboxylesterase